MLDKVFLRALFILSACALRAISNDLSCKNGSTCIPLSECNEITELIENDFTVSYARSFVCGYFHEPYVCCDRDCSTPNGNYGRRRLLDDCPDLKVLENSNNDRKQKFLDESYINDTHVCCNRGENEYLTVPAAPVVYPVTHTTPKVIEWSCITPNGDNARCTHISECEAYTKVAEETDKIFRFVNDSFCGLWKEPMICCGDVSFYKENYSQNLPNSEECGMWNGSYIPPWLAVIKTLPHSKMCIGALINHKYILTTVRCIGVDYKQIDIKLGECVNNEDRRDCSFQVQEIKTFPLHAYRFSEDVGIVLLKLNKAATAKNGLVPVCLPTHELAYDVNIDMVGVKKSNASWIGTRTSTNTISNYLCHNAMNEFLERIVCIKNKELCKNTPLLQNFLIRNNNNRWVLEGLFNKEICFGPNKDIFNAVYVFRFVSWIKSNIK